MLRAQANPSIPWLATAPAAGNATVNGIISATGGYNQYPPWGTVVAASNVKSHVLSGSDNAQYSYLDCVNIPANVVGPDGWLELEIDWGCNNSANVKGILLQYNYVNATLQDTQTTNQSSHFRVIIANRNNLASQMAQTNAPASGTGGSSTAAQLLTMSLNQPGNSINLTGYLAVASGSDSVWIDRWCLKAYNPPTYSTKRLNYGQVQFYGANAHFDDSQSISQHVADLQAMNMKTCRMTYEYGSSLTTLVQYAQAFQAAGIKMVCCLALPQCNTVIPATEAFAYQQGYSAGNLVASTLGPLGVQIYEAGNELDQGPGMIVGDPQGGHPADYSNTLIPVLRGLMRGCIDGVHAAGNYLCASNAFTTCGIGCSDMMWNGTQPDGTSGYTPVRWDLTNWHNYEDYGPITNVELGFQRPWVNLLAYLNQAYGVPIIITEWNAKASDTDAQRAFWATRFLGDVYNNRYKYNIAMACVYEMYGSPWNIMSGTQGVPESTFGTTVQTFITNNPDTGL